MPLPYREELNRQVATYSVYSTWSSGTQQRHKCTTSQQLSFRCRGGLSSSSVQSLVYCMQAPSRVPIRAILKSTSKRSIHLLLFSFRCPTNSLTMADSADLQTKFDAAAASVKDFQPSTPITDDEKLAAYKYYKQATVGDVNTERCVATLVQLCQRWVDTPTLPALQLRTRHLYHALAALACWTGPARPSGMPGTPSRVRVYPLIVGLPQPLHCICGLRIRCTCRSAHRAGIAGGSLAACNHIMPLWILHSAILAS